MSRPHLSAEEFRKMYMASLNAQTKIDKKNYDANVLFHQTGQPAPIEDTRSITEKLASLEQMKIQLRKDLLAITDKTNANQIVQELDDEENRFLYEQFQAIANEIKPRFRAGVPKDAFIVFLRKFMEKYELTGGVELPVEPTPITAPTGEVGNYSLDKKVTDEEFKKWLLAVKRDPQSLKGNPLRAFMSRSINELKRQIKSEPDLDDNQVGTRKDILESLKDVKKTTEGYQQWFIDNEDLLLALLNILSGMVGAGIIVGQGLGRNRPKVAKGVSERIRYKKYGRYIVDMDKLEGGVLSIKTGAGKNIASLPSKRVSKNVSGLVKKICGGELPTYEDIEGLNNDERKFLNQINKISRIDERIKIPAPDKTAEEKEMTEFEILRGSIIAGNDNKELVKKFKMLLVKFANDGRLPKGEARELLMDLASIGL